MIEVPPNVHRLDPYTLSVEGRYVYGVTPEQEERIRKMTEAQRIDLVNLLIRQFPNTVGSPYTQPIV